MAAKKAPTPPNPGGHAPAKPVPKPKPKPKSGLPSTAVNSQVTDSVTQAGVEVLGTSPSVALSNFYQATSQALSNSAHIATTSQAQIDVTAKAATTQCVAILYGIDSATTGVAVEKIYS